MDQEQIQMIRDWLANRPAWDDGGPVRKLVEFLEEGGDIKSPEGQKICDAAMKHLVAVNEIERASY